MSDARPVLRSACPILPAPDPAVAAAWYADKLGFRLIGDWGDYAIVDRDGVCLHFWRSGDRPLADATSAYINVADVDAIYATMQGAADGGRLIAPETKPWHMREFYVIDPNGVLLRFGEDVPAPISA